MNDYEAWVADGAVVPESSPPTGADALEDELLTSLRTAAGIDLARIHDVYGSEYEAAVRRGAREASCAEYAVRCGGGVEQIQRAHALAAPCFTRVSSAIAYQY